MNIINMKKNLYSIGLLMLLFSCGGSDIDVDSENANPDEINVINDSIIDNMDALTTKIGGKMFSIPSPIQMSLLLKDEVKTFNEEMISNPENVSNFSTTFKKAINMGVYGSDLGYATIYENNTIALSYLSSVEKLSDELGIADAFDEELINRFIENGNNQDSMLVIMSDGYREGDKFLKENEQHDIASLILTGGWIESLYFATQSYKQSKSQNIANRIGEQKSALITIIELLEDYNTDEYYTQLITDLNDLKSDFDKVEFNYQYIEPQTNEKEGLTIIKSKTSVNIDEETMNSITSKIEKIRNNLIS
jgi:hypothetical protein